MPSNLVKLVESAMEETQFRKVFTPQSENSFGRTAWSNANFHVDYGVGTGARVLQVSKSGGDHTHQLAAGPGQQGFARRARQVHRRGEGEGRCDYVRPRDGARRGTCAAVR
jgi:hypothetical protein